VWTLAGSDPERALRVARMPMALALEGYAHAVREQAVMQYRHDVLVWAMTAPHAKSPAEPPRLPDWAKE